MKISKQCLITWTNLAQQILILLNTKNMPADKFAAEVCGKMFTRHWNLLWNQQSTHGADSFLCQTCGKNFNRRDSHLRHTRNHIETSDKKPYDFETVDELMNCDSDDKENVCPNQSGGGKSSNDINGKAISVFFCVFFSSSKF